MTRFSIRLVVENCLRYLRRRAKRHGMPGVSGVRVCPSSRRSFGEEPFSCWTTRTRDTPGRNVVGIMTRVAFVIERELFERTVASPEFIELVGEIPLRVTPGTGDRRNVIDRCRIRHELSHVGARINHASTDPGR